MMPSILVIEDNNEMREGLAMVLEARGFEVRTACNGVEGLAILSEGWRPGVILLDLMMPLMNGREFRVTQLADPAIAAIPVILMSGHNAAHEQARDLSPVAWLQKPFTTLDLLNLVGNPPIPSQGCYRQ